MIFSDIIIIGAGAAGLMAAVGAAEKISAASGDTSVTVLEKMPRPGRKIMITGKGRCNFTNMKDWNEFSDHVHPKPNLLKPSFYNLTPAAFENFLNRNGLETVVERGDRAFPASHRSSDVVDTLVRAATRAGARILCGKEVGRIYCSGGGSGSGSGGDSGGSDITEKSGDFTIECTDGSSYNCRALIIATGGLSYPGTGSTGDGYNWAEEFGLEVTPLFPSLTAIVPEGYKTGNQVKIKGLLKGHIDRSIPLSETGEALAGIQLKNVGLTVIMDGNIVQEEFGDLDFTDGGIEGPIGFKVSRRCVRALLNGSKVTVSIDLKPAVRAEELEARIKSLWKEISEDRRSKGKNREDLVKVLLGKLLPQELVRVFLRQNPETDFRKLSKRLKDWRMPIEGYVGYERCVVTAGGVSASELVAKTLESKKVPGLYFAGEILDLDADTGGYNLQTAFSTGFLAGGSAALKLQNMGLGVTEGPF